ATVIWIFGLPLWLAFAFWSSESPFGLPWLALVTVILFPYWTARYLLIPLGAGRAAYVVGWLTMVRFAGDRRGGAAALSAWALLRRGRRDPDRIDRLEQRLTPPLSISDPPALRGAGVLAAGLIAALRGDDEGAHQLIASVEELDATVTPGLARALA